MPFEKEEEKEDHESSRLLYIECLALYNILTVRIVVLEYSYI